MSKIEEIDSVFRLIDREVWIVTSSDKKARGGLLATWVSQASIDRENPAILIGVAPNHYTAELIDASGFFAVHLIAAGQQELALNFAIGSGRSKDKFSGINYRVGELGTPILEECLSWLECRVFARLPTGDRNYYWADVISGNVNSTDSPLTEQELIHRATDDQRKLLLAGRDQDIFVQRPSQQNWRDELPGLLEPKPVEE